MTFWHGFHIYRCFCNPSGCPVPKQKVLQECQKIKTGIEEPFWEEKEETGCRCTRQWHDDRVKEMMG
jgi:hypothetical protein